MKISKHPLWKHAMRKGHLPLFFAAIGGNLIAAFCEGISYSLLLVALSRLCGVDSFPMIALSPPLLFSCAILLQLLRSGAQLLGQWITTRLAIRIQIDVQQALFSQIFSWSFAHASTYRTGDLIDYVRTPERVLPKVIEGLNQCIVSGMLIAVSLAILSFISPLLTLALVAIIGGVVWLQRKILAKVVRHSKALTKESVHLSQETTQSLQGLRAIFSHQLQAKTLAKLTVQLKELARIARRLYGWNTAIGPLQEGIAILSVGSISILGFLLLKEPILPSLLTFLALTYRLTSRLTLFATYAGEITVHKGALVRLREILVCEGQEFAPLSGTKEARFTKTLTFDTVTFRYPTSNQPAIETIDLTINKGEMVAFVGESGAGKSTLIDLILRLYEPTEGTIWVDGEDLKEIQAGSWRALIGVVSQEAFFFHDTVEKNISFGSPGASREKVGGAARRAHIDRLIDALPERYETVIGERGYRLSGGERQRIALARALVRDPALLILDEATSQLDSHHEAKIQEALEEIRGEKTVIVAAHRLSTVTRADCIYVFQEGGIIEKGRHRELLEQGGMYAHLWELQTRHAEPARH